ncbi:MAG: hypothetical protein HKN40_05030 [Winogradskyella sp.]|uniref:hypothetical protein n=1 Tax=Winogradskyella sp. TaxID=1883156 RepID=UPI0017C0C5FC|nr:hypothetical protein [Winogradskyella sp.]
MKTLKMLVLVVTITFSSVLSASTDPIENAEPKVIHATVVKLLEKPDFQLSEDIYAKVKVAINKEGELVVLSVDTKNEVVANFIKRRLNYKKVLKSKLKVNKSYIIPVKVIKSN